MMLVEKSGIPQVRELSSRGSMLQYYEVAFAASDTTGQEAEAHREEGDENATANQSSAAPTSSTRATAKDSSAAGEGSAVGESIGNQFLEAEVNTEVASAPTALTASQTRTKNPLGMDALNALYIVLGNPWLPSVFIHM